MKWWTVCCDQLFLGFKPPRLWVAQQCWSWTPLPTSRRGRHIAASFLDSRQGGNMCTLRGGKLVDQNRPQFAGLCLKPRTEPPKGRANWRLGALFKNGLMKCWEMSFTFRIWLTCPRLANQKCSYITATLFYFIFIFSILWLPGVHWHCERGIH